MECEYISAIDKSVSWQNTQITKNQKLAGTEEKNTIFVTQNIQNYIDAIQFKMQSNSSNLHNEYSLIH